ncbi:DUF2798 domain-containing protein [Fusibacter ferrireducens]|uniref:DUF2798 domain-containing protein n=1 Tax=Fusibacter ferrireducens TaxID=2785058 RepID=A0ABR9ZQS1_9FIRM|nr:DUF2798 domain-containing protein [Fusibacter ferrireducens]MBF4692807.1 DUF2798 domain-containing protein [Fusibacter ferrireducens]
MRSRSIVVIHKNDYDQVVAENNSVKQNQIMKGMDMKVSKVAQFVIYNLLASFGISLSISFFMTLMTNGLSNDFLLLWFKSFVMGYMIAVPSSMAVIPVVNRIMNRIMRET